jgi:hypothetical protein
MLISVRQAIQLCRTVTSDAQRKVANKTKGSVHAFDAWDARCFIALGEQVPSDLPYNHSQEQNYSGVQAPQNDELTRLRAENEALKQAAHDRELAQLRAENDALKQAQAPDQTVTADAPAEQIANQCTALTAAGKQCKGRAISDTGRCSFHSKTTEGENTDANERESESESSN